jgi:hypothetical protein
MDIVGKIYSKDEADSLYGSPLNSVKISVPELKTCMGKSLNSLMFRYEEGQFYIADNNRKVLNKDVAFSPAVVFTRFSISVIEDLIMKGNGDTAVMELRPNDVVTITINAFTMENGTMCPPLCN